jgi:FkbM family methyltransferase
MSWRYQVGSAVNRLKHALLSSPIFPLTRYVPPGAVWLYDVQRANNSRRANVIFDVGANTGQTAWGLVRYFPAATIYCFEPVSSSYRELLKNYGHRSNVRCVRAALGSTVEQRCMTLGNDPERNTLHSGGPELGGLSGEIEQVDVTTIDRFCADNGISEIDILKLDVQGWEMEVLRGCSLSPRHIFTEVGFRSDEKDMLHFSILDAHLQRAGYIFGGLYDSFRYGPAKQYVGFANALYVKRAQ